MNQGIKFSLKANDISTACSIEELFVFVS